jgi:hypothetical protein
MQFPILKGAIVMKFWIGAGMLFVVLSAGSAFGSPFEPMWLFADSTPDLPIFSEFRYCDTARSIDQCTYPYNFTTTVPVLDTGDSYDGSVYINLDYQFTSDTIVISNQYGDILWTGLRPGFAGIKTAWDGGMVGFPLSRYKYLLLSHKGPLSTHKVTVKVWYNDGQCGSTSYNSFIGTLSASDNWKDDTIPIPDSVQNKPDIARNTFKYYELVFIINNLDANDTTSGLPGCFKVDNIRLVGRNPIDTSPVSQKVTEGDAVTLKVATSRADSADILSYQWKKDGVDIAGTNDSVYTLGSVKTTDAGVYTVAVTVSSTNLSFTSQNSTLTVDAKEKEGCGCGAGTGAAIIPPLFFKAMAHRKRKKKNLNA